MDSELEHYRSQNEAPFQLLSGIARAVSTASKRGDRYKKSIFAQKTIELSDNDRRVKEDAKKAFEQEVKILRAAQHHHVIKLETAYYIDERILKMAIVMERATESIEPYLSHRRRQEHHLLRIRQWFGCLANAINHLHGIGIRHRDIKPGNILVLGDRVLLADFGLSGLAIGKTIPTTMPGWARGRTKAYCAPEVEQGSSRGRSADIFSLGAVFLEMLVAHSWWGEKPKLSKALKHTEGPSYAKKLAQVHRWMDDFEKSRLQHEPDDWRYEVFCLCRRMLQEDRHDRPKAFRLQADLPSLCPSPDPSQFSCGCTTDEVPRPNDMLVHACKEGKSEEVKRLVEAGANPGTVGAIHQASARGYPCIVQYLFDHHDEAALIQLRDHSDQTALHCAAGNGREAIVGILLEHGAKANILDVQKRTALHYAAADGNATIVEMLLYKDRGEADISAKDSNGQTALHFAAKRGRTDAVRRLLDQKAVCRSKDNKRCTALHFAAGSGSKEVVRELIRNGAHVDGKDERGWTALHYAASGRRATGKEYKRVVEILIHHGATRSIQDENSQTAYRLAEENDPRKELLKIDQL